MDKDREGQYTTIATSQDTFCAANIFNHYLRAAQLCREDKGPLFRAFYFDKADKKVKITRKRVSYTTAKAQLSTALGMVGLDTKAFSWHSLRSGAASEALCRGANLAEVRLQGRWASDEGVRPYIARDRKDKLKVAELLLL